MGFDDFAFHRQEVSCALLLRDSLPSVSSLDDFGFHLEQVLYALLPRNSLSFGTFLHDFVLHQELVLCVLLIRKFSSLGYAFCEVILELQHQVEIAVSQKERRASTTTKKSYLLYSQHVNFLILYYPIFKDLTMNNDIILKTSPSDQELNDNSMLCVSG